MSDALAQQISLFRSLIKSRRFDDATLRILESVLVSKSVKSLKEVESSLRALLRSESLSTIREIAEKPVGQKLLVLEFFVRAFALIADVESCLALRYEALHMRELESASCQWLEVSYLEWLNFAEHSLDNGFYSIAGKACENALLCLTRDIADPKVDEFFENVQVLEKIKRLKDFAMTSAASCSVQAQAAEYLKKKSTEKRKINPSFCTETRCVASTMFSNGIKRRNVQKLHELQRTACASHTIQL
ncbi:protein DOUBLE-STRAND BREAK FORMATION [Corylus avellana]|uniref:protein DOUBLE-STRAND BREAK FORMATION n=1 Tax=Corylus avellana TaxID=13451 RepID=UPI00286CC30A|nr:protein DOUBLE-STRAND BREAK FORMATION [Corylus avellana]XP_059430186.1 protein DOUBLE-STRAND BREAK FORMATION [Corylus avellana]